MKNLILLLVVAFLFSCKKKNQLPDTFDVEVHDATASSISLKWESPNASADLLYDVVLGNTTVLSDIQETQVTLQDLTPGTSYTGEVVAKLGKKKRSKAAFSAKTGENETAPDEDIALNLEVNKLLFDLSTTQKLIRMQLFWDDLSIEDEDVRYSIYIDGSLVRSDWTHYSYIHQNLSGGTAYDIMVFAFTGNDTLKEQISVEMPKLEDHPELLFSIENDYKGLTVSHFTFENLLPEHTNMVYVGGELIESDHNEPELLIEGIVPDIFNSFDLESEGSGPFNMSVISMKDPIIGSFDYSHIGRNFVNRPKQEDIVAHAYNVQDTYFDLSAFNNSSSSYFDESNTGPSAYKVYLNDNLLGTYKCYYEDNAAEQSLPRIENLQPNSTHKVKIEYVNESLFAVDTQYEPEGQYAVYREFEVTTKPTPLNSEKLSVDTMNITTNGFDLQWRTELSNLYACTIDRYYDFTLIIDGEEYTSFSSADNPVAVTGLDSDKLYNVTLQCAVKEENTSIPGDPILIETRSFDFDVQTN